MKVVIAPSARQDVLGIWAYIAKDNIAAADRVSERIFDSVEQLGRSPYVGERCDALGRGLRHTFVGMYVIFYSISEVDELVEVKAVIHGARNLPQDLSRRGLT